jgi:four helix bundle protein
VRINSATELEVYRTAYSLAMDIYRASRSFPKEEIYSLTSQIRRSSRSVCLNLREAWAKRRYEAHFRSKLTDCDGESAETETSLQFAKDCGYINEETFIELTDRNRSVGRMLGAMLRNPSPFLLRSDAHRIEPDKS